MAWTDEQELEFVEQALQAIYTGAQSYSVAGRTVHRGQLAILTERADQLRARINSAANNTFSVIQVDRPT